MQLQRLIGDFKTDIGAEAFGHGAQHGCIGIPAVERRGCAPDKGPRRLQFGRHVGKPELQRLEFVQAFSECLALAHVGERFVECGLRTAERACRDIDAAAIKSGHGNFKADAFLTEPVGDGDACVLENHRAGRLRVPAHLALVSAQRQSGRVALDHQCRDAAGPIRAGSHHHHINVAAAGARDELLLAVEHVVIAVAHRAAPERRRVRSRPRFGKAVTRQQFHGAELRQPFLPLRVAAERIDHPGCHVVDRDERRHCRAALRQGLKNQRRVKPRQRRTADVVAYINAAHAQRCGLPHHIGRKMLLLIPADRMRRDLFRGKIPRHIANRKLVLIESELHPVSAPVCAIVRCQFMVGIGNSAPSLTPEGQRAVTVLVLV